MIPNKHTIEVKPENPFENDKLGRQRHVENFEQIVSLYSETGCVMAINGAWGTGKTTFVQMLVADMKKKRMKPLYFNAWENDFVSDPLVALLAELNELHLNDDKYDKLLACGLKIAVDVVGGIVKSVLKNKLGIDTESVAEGIADTLKGEVDEYANQKKSLHEFKEALVEYVADNSEGGPVVFFIDELDRCNPRFAVQVLERVKHLFDVPNMVFVLVINKDQLYHAIRGYYGSASIDAENYLRRFIDIEYQMPESDRKVYFELLYSKYGLDKILNTNERRNHGHLHQEAETFHYLMRELIEYSDFDLRTIDKFFAYTCLVFQSYGKMEYIFPNVFLILNYLRFTDSELYQQIRKHAIKPIDLVEKLDESFAPILIKMNSDVEYFRKSLLYPLARLIYAYYPDIMKDEYVEQLKAIRLQNIDVAELFETMKEANQHSIHGEREMEYALQHLDLTEYVRLSQDE